MAAKTSQSTLDRGKYIPPAVQQTMAEHMQKTMPANLKKYQNSGTYVPEHIQRSMAEHMQKTMPAHMQEYINPYLEQNVVAQKPGSVQTPTPTGAGTQNPAAFYASDQNARPSFSDGQAVATDPQPQTDSPAPAADPEQAFDFIMNPEKPKRSNIFKFPKANGARILLAAGVLLVIIVLFALISSLAGGGGKMTYFVAVAQQQQELIHLTSSTSALQTSLTPADQNFIATAQLSLSSAQGDTLSYLSRNGVKVGTKELNLKINGSVDNQLSAAQSAGTYEKTFQEVMLAQLQNYQNYMKEAYKTAGKNGKALLNSQYIQSQLLTNQLQAAANSGG